MSQKCTLAILQSAVCCTAQSTLMLVPTEAEGSVQRAYQRLAKARDAQTRIHATALPAEALDVGDRHTLHAQSAQGLANFLELEGLDDGGHESHLLCPWCWQPQRSGGRTMVHSTAELKRASPTIWRRLKLPFWRT